MDKIQTEVNFYRDKVKTLEEKDKQERSIQRLKQITSVSENSINAMEQYQFKLREKGL